MTFASEKLRITTGNDMSCSVTGMTAEGDLGVHCDSQDFSASVCVDDKTVAAENSYFLTKPQSLKLYYAFSK